MKKHPIKLLRSTVFRVQVDAFSLPFFHSRNDEKKEEEEEEEERKIP